MVPACHSGADLPVAGEGQKATSRGRKSVCAMVVTDQDRAPAVIGRALEEHELAGEQPADYQLVQILSGDGTLQIPDGANVYYAMAPSPDYRFLLLRKTTPLDAEVKERALSALRGSRQKGPRFERGNCNWSQRHPPQPQGPLPFQVHLAKSFC
nr:ral guanine nucleotide dissociation stimulator-like [Dasypus novemcinctus]